MKRLADEDGFTVIELLVAMIVMMIITVPLVTSFVLGLTVTREGQQDTTNSADAQLVSLWFDKDIASAETVEVSSPCGGVDTVLRVSWLDGSEQHDIAYLATADPAAAAELGVPTAYRLDRQECSGGSPVESVTLARSLVSPPVIRCDGVLCSASTIKPRNVRIELTSHGARAVDPTYGFSLTATRKVAP